MIALIAGKENVTFTELTKRVHAEAAGLSPKLANQIQVLTASSTIDFVVKFLACLEAKLPVAILAAGGAGAESEARLALLKAPCHPETAVILFTSGSTGTPKAVQLSQANIDANTRGVITSLDFSSAKEQTLFLPLSYSYGLLGQLLPALECKIQTRLLEKFTDVKGRFDDATASGMWSGVPAHWETILRSTDAAAPCNEKITHIISAGAPMPVSLRERLRERFPKAILYNNYGQTEASPRLLCYSSRDPEFFTGGVGRPVGDAQIKLSHDGELEVRGSQIMLGYLGDKDATATKLKDGWLHTGDSAEISANGLVSILGRRDELFNVGGERTSPSEIENALKTLPGITDAAVFIEDDPLYGSKMSAFLVGPLLTKNQLVSHLAEKLSPHKTPKDYYTLEKLPRGANGKLIRSELGNLKTPERRLR